MAIKSTAKLTRKQRREIESYYAYAISIASNLGSKTVKVSDDVRSAAHSAIIEACQKYDKSRKVSLPTYIGYIVRNRIADQRRSDLRRLDRYEQADIVTLVDPKVSTWGIEAQDLFDWLTSELSTAAVELLRAFFRDGMTVFQYAKHKQIEDQEAFKIYRDSISAMRKRYAEISLESRYHDRGYSRSIR
jgi:DNA-directed RNA polymerase specialized sigma subunit